MTSSPPTAARRLPLSTQVRTSAVLAESGVKRSACLLFISEEEEEEEAGSADEEELGFMPSSHPPPADVHPGTSGVIVSMTT